MAKVVDLDIVVPEDIEFRKDGEVYSVPGDLKVTDALRLYKLMRDIEQASPAEEDEEQEATRLAETTAKTMLAIFQIRQPDMTEWPFGQTATNHILRSILVTLGVIPDPDKPDPTPPKRAKSKPRARSRRSI